MKRTIATLALALTFSTGAFAQNSGMGSGTAPVRFVQRSTIPFRTFGSNTGFGNILFPGTGNPPPPTPASTFPFGFPTALPVSAFPQGHGGRHHGGSGGVIPIPYPVYVGGGYYGDPSMYEQQPQQQPPANITIVMPPQQPAPPPVTINQYSPDQQPQAAPPEPRPGVNTYQAPSSERPAADDDQVLFFIALKDSSIYTAVAYWVEDGILHYITTQGRHNQASLDLVDRETSAKLNQGRKVEFRLPRPR